MIGVLAKRRNLDADILPGNYQVKAKADLLRETKEHQRLLASHQKLRKMWVESPAGQLCSTVQLGLLPSTTLR